MKNTIRPLLVLFLALSLITGLAYPLLVTALAQALYPAQAAGSLIVIDGKPIGSITTKGVPVTLKPQMFGPGYARLGIIQVHAKAGNTPGTAQIVAALQGGTEYVINLIIEQP